MGKIEKYFELIIIIVIPLLYSGIEVSLACAWDRNTFSFDDEEMPLDATDRIALYTTKLSQKYNVLGLVMTIDKDENCKIIDDIYQKNKDTYYTQLHLPKTVLTAEEYIDIMSRL